MVNFKTKRNMVKELRLILRMTLSTTEPLLKEKRTVSLQSLSLIKNTSDSFSKDSIKDTDN